jgi:hypothetical protein
MGHYVYQNMYQFGFEAFVTLETNLVYKMLRQRLVLCRNINVGGETQYFFRISLMKSTSLSETLAPPTRPYCVN